MMQLTLEIVAKALFGAELGGDSAEVSSAMETLMHSFVASTARAIIVPQWLPTPSNLRVASGGPAARMASSSDHRRAATGRRGPGRPALDAAPCPGRGERPADDRPAAPRRVHDPVPRRPRDHGQHARLGLVPPVSDTPTPRPSCTRSSTACSKAAPPLSPTSRACPIPSSVVTESLRSIPPAGCSAARRPSRSSWAATASRGARRSS